MALSKTSVEKGIAILKQVNLGVKAKKYEMYDPEEDYSSVKHIHCINEKADGGFESIFTNIENMTDDQLESWEALKEQIPNTSITRTEGKGITCIGWF